MADKAWKAEERRVASLLGGHRNRMSGAVDQLTAGDVIHDVFYVEVRTRASLAVVTWFKEARANAIKEGKIPLLALKQKHDKTRYYVFREQDAEEVAAELLRTKGWEIDD